jgi:hypothetical protein
MDIQQWLQNARLGRPEALLKGLPLLFEAFDPVTANDEQVQEVAEILSIPQAQEVLKDLCRTRHELLQAAASHPYATLRKGVPPLLSEDAPKNILTSLFLDPDLGVHKCAAKYFRVDHVDESAVMAAIAKADAISLRIIEALLPDIATLGPKFSIAPCLLDMMTSEDVLLQLNALEVFCEVASEVPAMFLPDPRLPSVISTLLTNATRDNDLTVVCFAFRFLARLSQIGAGSALAVQHGWVDVILDALLAMPSNTTSENVLCSGFLALGHIGHDTTGQGYLRGPANCKKLRNLWEREICDDRRTSQTAAATTIAAFECFSLLLSSARDVFVALFPSPTDPLWQQALSSGPSRRNVEVRGAFVKFIGLLLVQCPTALEYVLASATLREYLCNVEAERDEGNYKARRAVWEAICDNVPTEPWLSLVRSSRVAAPIVAMDHDDS